MLRGLLAVLAAVGIVPLTPILDGQPPPAAGGAIAGRILTATGEPVLGIMLHALRQITDASGHVTAGTTAMAQANERGEFRLAGLPEGSYLVIATLPPPPQFGYPARPSGAPVTLPTYYPGAASADAAESIAVVSGQIDDGLQFSMVSTPGYNVSGVVIDDGGSPLPNVAVTLIVDAGNGGISSPVMGRSDDQGTFLISGVVPGSYRVLAGTPMMTATREGPATVTGGLVGGGVPVTGGVFLGGRGVAATGGAGVGGPGVSVGGIGGPGVLPPAGTPAMMPTAPPPLVSTPVDVIVGSGDVTGVKIFVLRRQ